MYENGQGVSQDYNEAARWYREAADQGNATAQYNLARMYGLGQGVSQNYVYSHMWLSLAVANGNGFEIAAKTREALEKLMTPSQIEEAQRLAREWKPKKSK
jgi:TPR repeat protein